MKFSTINISAIASTIVYQNELEYKGAYLILVHKSQL